MGRQHTIYLSDKTWEQLESLKREGETMSHVMRVAVALCADNKDKFDLLEYNQKKIEGLTKRIMYLENNVCPKCHYKLVIE